MHLSSNMMTHHMQQRFLDIQRQSKAAGGAASPLVSSCSSYSYQLQSDTSSGMLSQYAEPSTLGTTHHSGDEMTFVV